ncbi:hypothetical protein [Paraburkholderia pallida]|uniref:hypothetical protein n=1 Tax=Paraburkholderia pallida TaxID=2547399 RepID=UPI001430E02D|nr:hypothetical protein [Paraburkholderia pallida]
MQCRHYAPRKHPFRFVVWPRSAQRFSLFGVQCVEAGGERRALDAEGRARLSAAALHYSRQSRYYACTVTSNHAQVTTMRSHDWYAGGAQLARVMRRTQEKDGVTVAGSGDAADPELDTDGAHTPSMRAAEGEQQVRRDEHDADGNPRDALDDKAAALPAGHDREARRSRRSGEC